MSERNFEMELAVAIKVNEEADKAVGFLVAIALKESGANVAAAVQSLRKRGSELQAERSKDTAERYGIHLAEGFRENVQQRIDATTLKIIETLNHLTKSEPST